jgi:hypothetical protein
VHPPLAQAYAPPPPVPLTFHGWHSAELDRRRQELRQQKRLQGQRQRQRQQQGGAAAGAITPSSFSSSSSTASSHSPSSGGRVGGGRRRLWLPALLPLVAQTDSQSPSVREPQPLPLGGVGGGPKGTARKWKKQGGRGTAIGAEPVAMLAVPKSARGRRKRGQCGSGRRRAFVLGAGTAARLTHAYSGAPYVGLPPTGRRRLASSGLLCSGGCWRWGIGWLA